MWSTTENEGHGGGGFLDSTYGEDGSAPGKSDSVRTTAVVPLMIGHLLEDSLDSLKLWGKKINLVSLVAYVRKFERATTKISYELVDETGTIMAFEWIEDGSKKAVTTVPAGSYARVVGAPREQDGSRHVFILKVMPVNGMADVFAHLLETTYVCLRGKEIYSEHEDQESDKSMAMTNETEMDSCHGMDKDQSLVFKVIKSQNHTDTGIEKSVLKSQLPPNVKNKFEDILEFLTSEGHIYSTCTDDHFKTT